MSPTEVFTQTPGDFGPGLVAYFLGWGSVAIPGSRDGWLTVYTVAPVVGGCLGWGARRAAVRLPGR